MKGLVKSGNASTSVVDIAVLKAIKALSAASPYSNPPFLSKSVRGLQMMPYPYTNFL